MNKNGFSLIELVIAMAIIAIISNAIIGNFISSLAKGRDSRRKQDLDSISKALEIYYSDLKVYPTVGPTWGAALVNPNNQFVVYMQKTPNDPSYPNKNYCYVPSSDASSYRLYADMENTNDPKIFPTPTTVECPSGSGVYYNYGISSVNTTPL